MNDPFPQFEQWYREARKTEPNDSNAMALATVDGDARPSVRMVLLKGHGPDGFIFYTNMEGRKAQHLRANPHAALLFHWKSARRQIRIEGAVSPVDDATADAYFASRGRESQLGAWASDQSRPLPSREIFAARFKDVQARFEGKEVPRPPHWSGLKLVPVHIEFWQDRDHRLHERLLYSRPDPDSPWQAGLLYP